jgi:hypothetical protein
MKYRVQSKTGVVREVEADSMEEARERAMEYWPEEVWNMVRCPITPQTAWKYQLGE